MFDNGETMDRFWITAAYPFGTLITKARQIDTDDRYLVFASGLVTVENSDKVEDLAKVMDTHRLNPANR